MSTCKAKNCRFNISHVTQGHRCGKCKKFGHGDNECENTQKIINLKKETINDQMTYDDHCKITECKYKWSHNTSAHHCRLCDKREHGMSTCPLNRRNKRKAESDSSIYNRWDNDSILFATPKKEETNQSNYCVKCPTCRAYSNFENITKIFVDSQCIVCMDEKAQVLLPECSHLCICAICCDKMNESRSSSSSSSSSD